MEDAAFAHSEAIAAATDVLDRHLAALNSGDAVALAQTLHFPHYRLAGSRMQVWERPETYLRDFHARAGDEWHHSAWDFAIRSAPVRTRSTWTYNSAVTPPRRRIATGAVSLHLGGDLHRSAVGRTAAIELCRLIAPCTDILIDLERDA